MQTPETYPVDSKIYTYIHIYIYIYIYIHVTRSPPTDHVLDASCFNGERGINCIWSIILILDPQTHSQQSYRENWTKAQ